MNCKKPKSIHPSALELHCLAQLDKNIYFRCRVVRALHVFVRGCMLYSAFEGLTCQSVREGLKIVFCYCGKSASVCSFLGSPGSFSMVEMQLS